MTFKQIYWSYVCSTCTCTFSTASFAKEWNKVQGAKCRLYIPFYYINSIEQEYMFLIVTSIFRYNQFPKTFWGRSCRIFTFHSNKQTKVIAI